MSKIRFIKSPEPNSPTTGKTFVYIDEADSHLKTKDDAGSVLDLTITFIPNSLVGSGGITVISGTNITTISGNPNQSKSITVEDPVISENIIMFFASEAITINQVAAVISGSNSPSLTIELLHATNKASAGNAILNAPTAVTSITTPQFLDIDSGDTTVPDNSFVWLTTTASGATVNSLSVTTRFTID